MRTTTSNYDTENASLTKKPVWAVQFENVNLQSNFNLCTNSFDATNSFLNNHVSSSVYHKERDIIDTSNTGEYSAAISECNFAPQVYNYRGEYNRTYFTWIKASNIDHMVCYYDHDDNEMSTPVSASYYTASATDPHGHSSIIVADDGHIIVVYEQLTGVAASAHNSPWVVKRSVSPETTDDGFYTADGALGDYNAYPKLFKLSNGDLFILGRYGPDSGDHYRVGYYKSTDNGKTWGSLVTVATMSDAVNYWAYNMRLASSDSDGLHICINAQDRDSGTGLGYPVCYYLWSEDGDTWYDIDSSFSKDVTSAAITLAELDANCIIDDQRAVDRDYVRYITAGVVSDEGNPYLVMAEGDRNNSPVLDTWSFWYYDAGWQHEDITGVLAAYTDFWEDCVWGIVSYTEDKFDIYVTADVDSTRELLRYQTTDKGVTWTLVEELTEDSTYEHQYMAITTNHPDWEYICYASSYLENGTTSADVAWGVHLRVTTFFPYLQNVKYNSPRISVELSLTDFGDLDFDIVDKDNSFTKIIAEEKKICNDKISLYHGYGALDFDDFSLFPYFYVDGISLSQDMLVCSVQTRTTLYDIFQNRTLFREIPTTQLTAAVTGENGGGVEDTSLTVEDESDFNGTTDFSYVDSYVIVNEQEIMKYGGKTANGAGTDTFDSVTRDIYSVVGQSMDFTEGMEVKQCYRLAPNVDDETNCTGRFENPFLIMLNLMTTTSAGTNGDFDLGLANWGMEVPYTQIETYNIQRLGLKYHAAMESRYSAANRPNYNSCRNKAGFWYKKVDNPFEFFTKWFLQPARAFFYISENSKLDIKQLDALDDDSDGTIDDDTIIKVSNIKIRYDLVMNKMGIYELNPITLAQRTSATTKEWEYEASESTDKVGDSQTWIINDLFMHRHRISTTWDGDEPFRRFFGTFGNPPVEMDITVLDSKNQFMAGDVISISSDVLPDWNNQGRGVTSLKGLVLEQKIGKYTTSYKLLLFDAVNALDMYTVTKHTDDLDAEEIIYQVAHGTAYGDYDTNYDVGLTLGTAESCDFVRLKFKVTPPSNPTNADSWEYVDIHVQVWNDTPTLYAESDNRFHYNTDMTDDFYIWLDVYWKTSTIDLQRVRADYYNQSTAVANDQLDAIYLDEVWVVKENFSTSSL